MTLSRTFEQLIPAIEEELRQVLACEDHDLRGYYHMLFYHLGWVDADGKPVDAGSGKRIRPVLCLLCCQAMSQDWQRALPAAAAVELIHNFSLLHDDIQDDSPVRRGRTTVWKIWGEAQAINAGDALFALAHLAVQRLRLHDVPPLTVLEALSILDETCLRLTQGQHLDMLFEQRDHVQIDQYLKMIAGKSAALMAASTGLGGLVGGAQGQTLEHYRAFGHNLGMAFQVLDDILDIWGDPCLTGKRAATDLYNRKKSLPVIYALERSPEVQRLYQQSTHPTDGDVQAVVSLLEDLGTRRYAEDTARIYSDEALKHLEATQPSEPAATALRQLCDYLLQREL
jgi:geranylgeranyl diphosphate synthase type I